MAKVERQQVLVAATESDVSTYTWFIGMMMASVFSIVYLITPIYLLAATSALMFQFPSRLWSIVFSSPLLLSLACKPVPSPWLVGMMTPVLQYFQFELIVDTSKVDVPSEIRRGKNYILACQPHGVVSS